MCRTACLYDVPREYRTWSRWIKRLNTAARIVGVESPMTAKWPLPFVLVLGVTATRAAGPTVTIDTASPSGKVSPLFYGLMTEEINHAYDGGLYAELVRNRAFLDDAATASALVARPSRRFDRDDGARSKGAAQHDHRDESAVERDPGLDRSRGWYSQRGLLGHSGYNPTRATVRPSTPRPRPDSPDQSPSRSRATTAGRSTRRRPSPG